MTAASVLPWIFRMVNARSPAGPSATSYTGTMPGCSSWPWTRISRRKRARARGKP